MFSIFFFFPSILTLYCLWVKKILLCNNYEMMWRDAHAFLKRHNSFWNRITLQTVCVYSKLKGGRTEQQLNKDIILWWLPLQITVVQDKSTGFPVERAILLSVGWTQLAHLLKKPNLSHCLCLRVQPPSWKLKNPREQRSHLGPVTPGWHRHWPVSSQSNDLEPNELQWHGTHCPPVAMPWVRGWRHTIKDKGSYELS